MCRLKETYLSDMLVFESPLLGKKYGIDIYFTSRVGGNSSRPYDSLNLAFHVGDDKNKVIKNRQKVSQLLNLGPYMYHLKQAHSSNMVLLDQGNKDILKKETAQADAMVTCLKNVPLMVMGADCNLVILADRVNRLIAVIHSGWRGTVNKILARVISYIGKKFSSSPPDMLMYMGPSIRSCCYSIGKDRLDEFKRIYGDGNYYHNTHGKIYIDLPALIRRQARDMGICRGHIYDSNLCTFCDERFFSYRRERITGRQAAIGVVRG